MELVFIFAIVFVQMFFINAGEVMQIEGALRVDAFVDAEELPALFWDKGVPAIRTHEPNGRGNHLSRDERLATDLALVLSVPDIVIVEIVVRLSLIHIFYIIIIGIIGITSEKIIKYLERKFTGWQETREI